MPGTRSRLATETARHERARRSTGHPTHRPSRTSGPPLDASTSAPCTRSRNDHPPARHGRVREPTRQTLSLGLPRAPRRCSGQPRISWDATTPRQNRVLTLAPALSLRRALSVAPIAPRAARLGAHPRRASRERPRYRRPNLSRRPAATAEPLRPTAWAQASTPPWRPSRLPRPGGRKAARSCARRHSPNRRGRGATRDMRANS